MHNPVLFVRHLFDEAHELHAVVEIMLQPARVEQFYQRIFKLVAEYLADRGDMYVVMFRNDYLAAAVDAAPRHNHVGVYMKLLCFPIGVQHGNHPGFQAELVHHPVFQRVCRSPHQNVQYFFLVALHQVQQDMRQGHHNMAVRHSQQLFLHACRPFQRITPAT